MKRPLAIALMAPLLMFSVAPHHGPTAKQKSQMAYLEHYGHTSNGKAPDAAQALSDVLKYPGVPTMAQAKAGGLTGQLDTAPVRVAIHATHSRAMVARTIDRTWQLGVPDLKELGHHQHIMWKYNIAYNHVCCHDLHGYPWIAAWASWLWGWDNEQTTNGYPYWEHGDGPEVAGPLQSLVLAMTGREGAHADLSGEGVATLASRS